MRVFLFLVLCVAFSSLSAQDLTGIWRGSFYEVDYRRDDEGNKIPFAHSRYKMEVQLAQNSTAFEGVTYSYLTTVFYGKATARGTVNKKNKKVFLEELKIVEVRMAMGSDACVMTLFLQYSKMGEDEFLEGTYTGMNTRDSSRCGEGKIFLRKVETSDFYKEPFLIKRENDNLKKTTPPVVKNTPPATKPPAPKTTTPVAKNTTSNTTKKPVTPPKNTTAKKTTTPSTTNTKSKTNNPPVVKNTPPSTSNIKIATIDSVKKIDRKIAPAVVPRVLATRQNELVRTITTDATEIVVKLYDNGTIDNDTVSIYLDKKLMIANQRLTDKPLTLKFNLDDDNDFHELVMVAENLGEIPPNTSLMVVTAGNKQYEVRITSNEQKNAVVIFKFEK